MAAASTLTTVQSSNSSVRTPVLARPNTRNSASKTAVVQVGAARRLFNALMQSLAAPHI
jgi:hypothetical protein